MTRRLREGLMLIGMGVMVVAAGIGIAVVSRPSTNAGLGAAEPEPERSHSSDADAVAYVPLGGDTYDLLYDATNDVIWAAVFQIGSPDKLVRINALSGAVDQWPLPDIEHNGYLGQVELDASGAVWVSANYMLARFDPRTEELGSVVLPEEADGAAETALDVNDPLPGTWISSIAVVGDQVLVARNNVPHLTRFSPGLVPTRDISIPVDYMGARDVASVGDTTYLLSGPKAVQPSVASISGGKVEVLSDDGLPEERLLIVGDAVLTTSGRNLHGPEIAPRLGAGGLATVAAEDGVVAYDAGTGSVTLHQAGQVVAEHVLESIEVVVYPPPPATEAVHLQQPPRLTDIVVDARGTVWYAVVDDQGLRNVTLAGT